MQSFRIQSFETQAITKERVQRNTLNVFIELVSLSTVKTRVEPLFSKADRIGCLVRNQAV